MKSYKVLIESVNHRCGPNLIDCARLYNYLIKNEHVVINNVSEADYIIINSCGFINEQKDRSINFFKKYNVIKKKNAKIIMYGCLVNINKDLFKNLDLIQIGINENHKFDKIFYKATKFELVKPYCKSELNDILFKDNISFTFRGRIPLLLTKIFIPFSKKLKINYNHILNAISYRNLNFIEISKGCTGNCSFCAIKKAKGKIYSRNKDDIISDIKEIYDTTKPLFLVADDCSSFGIDIDSNLIELIYEINKTIPI